MDNSRPLQSVDPRPMSSPGDTAQQSYQQPYQQPYQEAPYQEPYQQTMPGTMPQYRPDSLPQHPSPNDISQPLPPQSGIGLHLGPEAQIPDHPGSTYNIPRPPTQTFTGQQQQQQLVNEPLAPKDLRNVRASCLFQLREFITLKNKSKRADASVTTLDLQNQIRNQAGLAVLDLKMLQAELRQITKEGEEHRWRRWLVGGVIATFIPLVRRIFRRGDDEESQLSANDTEYAWNRARGLLARIKDSIIGKGSLASIAFFVFAVLFIFQNEVKLRVARTIRKRVRKLCARLEAGDETIEDADLEIFDGWRWRIVS